MIQLLKTEDALKCFLFNFPKSTNMVTVSDLYGNDYSIGMLKANLARESLFCRHDQRRSISVGVTVLPDDEQALASLMSYALSKHQDQAWLLPEYQDTMRRLLVHNGFHEMGCCFRVARGWWCIFRSCRWQG